jgi:voltage-gated potassium channel
MMSERMPRPDPEQTGGPTARETIHQRWRFGVVLFASLLLAVAQPLTAGLIDEDSSFEIFFSLLIVAVMVLVFEEREHRRTAISLGLAAFLGLWASHVLDGLASRLLAVTADLLAACFFAFALYGILRAIFVKHVSGDAILGAVCGYLLLGIIWSLVYSAVETASPGSFGMPAREAAEVAAARPDRGVLSYYSFITLATVGYGDVTPITPLTRTLAWIEAVTGQFYLAVLVAGIVGFKAAASEH